MYYLCTRDGQVTNKVHTTKVRMQPMSVYLQVVLQIYDIVCLPPNYKC